MCWPLLRPGGVIVFDDYLGAPERPLETRPCAGIDPFLASIAGEFDFLWRGYQVAIRKTPEVVSASTGLQPGAA